MIKYLVFVATMVLQAQIILADNAERQTFIDRGYNWGDYQKAQLLNLDLENYAVYHSNKIKRVTGTVMIATGGWAEILGIFSIRKGALINKNLEYGGYSYIFAGENPGNPEIVFGSISCGTGLGLLIAGAVLHHSKKSVYTKCGTKISLLPKLDISNNEYGTQLSVSF